MLRTRSPELAPVFLPGGLSGARNASFFKSVALRDSVTMEETAWNWKTHVQSWLYC